MVEVREEIVLRTADEGPVDTASVRLPADDIGLLQVDQLRLGCWVEFQEDEENTLRCKLAAVIDATGKYIFVNRTGMKVLERNRIGLALESVIGNLRRLNHGK